MKTNSPGERRESRGWCQEILRVMNWNLLIRDWKIQPEPDPIQEFFRGRTGRRKGGRGCCLYLPGSCAHLKWRKPWHPVWGRKGLIASRCWAGQEVECMWSGSQGGNPQVTRVWRGAPWHEGSMWAHPRAQSWLLCPPPAEILLVHLKLAFETSHKFGSILDHLCILANIQLTTIGQTGIRWRNVDGLVARHAIYM